MKIIFSESAWDDYLYWQNNDRRMLERVNLLINEACRSPFESIGKPEPLRHALKGFWSRRINEEHRLVYAVQTDAILIAQCRYHY
ncbi:MAG: Txe/YoeB family addiction module toxin [Isosphaeraceae bacterium]